MKIKGKSTAPLLASLSIKVAAVQHQITLDEDTKLEYLSISLFSQTPRTTTLVP